MEQGAQGSEERHGDASKNWEPWPITCGEREESKNRGQKIRTRQ